MDLPTTPISPLRPSTILQEAKSAVSLRPKLFFKDQAKFSKILPPSSIPPPLTLLSSSSSLLPSSSSPFPPSSSLLLPSSSLLPPSSSSFLPPSSSSSSLVQSSLFPKLEGKMRLRPTVRKEETCYKKDG